MSSAERRHAEHSSAGSHDFVSALIRKRRSRMEYHHIVVHIRESADDLALFVASRISARSENNAHRLFLLPLYLDIRQPVIYDRIEYINKIAVKPHQHRLRFRVAETIVEFYYLRTVVTEHQSYEEHPLEVESVLLKAFERRHQDLIHDALLEFRRKYETRRIRAHSARVRSLVTVKYSLVILRRFHRNYRIFIDKAEHRCFHARQVFLHDNSVARIAEHAHAHHLFDRLFRVRLVLGYDNALAGSETVRLYYHGIAVNAHRVEQRLLIRKFLIACGRYVVAGKKCLCKRFAGFKLRALLVRSEHAHACRTQRVRNPHSKRHLGTDDRHINAVFRGKTADPVYILRLYIHALGNAPYSRIARRTVYLFRFFALCKLPADSVLTPAASHYKYLHIFLLQKTIPLLLPACLPYRAEQ